MVRFFVSPEDVIYDRIKLSAEDSEHVRSLRLRPVEEFVVCDGRETDYVCCLSQIPTDAVNADKHSYARIIRQEKSCGEPSINCSVFVAYTKGDRLEYAVQKSVELGAHSISLFESSRCVARPDKAAKKTERYQKIALETAKQCARGIVPEVSEIGSFREAIISAANNFELTILCYEDAKNLHLRTVLEHFFPGWEDPIVKPRRKIKSIAVFTGPEGGFEPSEVELAQEYGFSIVSLGPRILRSETAPAAVLSAIMYHTGNL